MNNAIRRRATETLPSRLLTPLVSLSFMLLLWAGTEALATEQATLEKCDGPKGTLAIAEPQGHVVMALRAYNLPPPTQLLRQYVQNSNCFQVLERGLAMQNIQQERDLASDGMLQKNSNMGGSQMVTADFVMTADVLFKDKNAGGAGVGAAVGSLFGGIGSIVGAVAGGLKFQEASTTLTLSDVRSTMQVAAASGVYKNSTGLLGRSWRGRRELTRAPMKANWLQAHCWTTTTMCATWDDPSLLQSTSQVGQANAQAALQAISFQPGAVLSAKLDNVKVMSAPARDADVVAKLAKNEDVVFLGESQEGYILIQGADAEGWVREILIGE